MLEDWKQKCSVLWLFYAVAFVAVLALGLAEPGVMQHFLDTGEIGGMKSGQELLLFFAIMILVPLAMAFLSLTMKDSTSRWTNIILGTVFTLFQLFALISTILEQPSSYYAVLMETSKVVAPALIVRYAWPKRKPQAIWPSEDKS